MEQKSFVITRLGAKGQVTIPAEYRRALSLSGDAPLVLVRLGDALVIAPHDDALATVTERLETQMRHAGSDVEELIAAATSARAEIVREEFGIADEE
jgi:bifunctional DNA-binding transcriptional regulator/antitoxin component of YhaV-PrlF toxin-antitoxin module